MPAVKVQAGEISAQLSEHEGAFSRLVDYAFWQLMLVDDLGVAEILVEEACYRLKTRMAELLAAYAMENPSIPEAAGSRIPAPGGNHLAASEIAGCPR